MQLRSLPDSTHAHVLLRPIEREDLANWFGYLSSPAVYEHTSWDVRAAEELESHVWSSETAEPSPSTRFAIALRTSNQLVGTAGFHSVSQQDRRAEIAFDLAQELWGKGIATYITGLLTEWAHASAGIIRVQATVLTSNQRSAKVLERCAYEREGLLRSYRLVHGKPGDFWVYSHVAGGASN